MKKVLPNTSFLGKPHLLLQIFFFLFLLFIGVYGYVAFFLPFSLPPLPHSPIFLDRNGEEIGEIPYSGSIRHRPLTYNEIPHFYKTALITLEDKTFWTNNGVSVRGILRSVVQNIRAGKVVEGASTLSSGLVRNAFWIREDRSVKRKLLEFLYAVRMNHMLTKEEILTEYINRVGYGYLNYGLGSASIFYFGKEVNTLTEAEQLALLLLPKDPKKYDPYLQKGNFRTRYEGLVESLRSSAMISQTKSQELLSEKLIWNTTHEARAPYVKDFLAQKTLGMSGKIMTSFDLALTERITNESNHALDILKWRNVTDYGVLIAERGTSMKLRVMIGGRAYQSNDAGQVNTTMALRQPGSTIKPFTYLLAFMKLGLTPESTILDLPTSYTTIEGYSYEPKNYSREYLGEISLRRALAESVNIPSVKLLDALGVGTLLQFLRSLGITSLTHDADHYGLALTLGGGEVSLYELLGAYTIFSQSGALCPILFLAEDKRSCTPRIETKYVDMVISILTDRYAKIGSFPLHSALDFVDRFVFVKTGTSRNFRDNWAIGFTEHYLIGVWVGNKSGENMKGVSGATGAGEIFRRIVYSLEPDEYESEPPANTYASEGQQYLTITKPLAGSVYDVGDGNIEIIPEFRTNFLYDVGVWKLDGETLTGRTLPITLGDHSLELFLMNEGVMIETTQVKYKGVSEDR